MTSIEWDEPEPAPKRRQSEKRQRSAMVSVRLNRDELRQVQLAAEARGLAVSTFLRVRALERQQLVWGGVEYAVHSLPAHLTVTPGEVDSV